MCLTPAVPQYHLSSWERRDTNILLPGFPEGDAYAGGYTQELYMLSNCEECCLGTHTWPSSSYAQTAPHHLCPNARYKAESGCVFKFPDEESCSTEKHVIRGGACVP